MHRDDKQNYREIRNIFSSNETFDPKNIIATDPEGNTHAIWDKINDTSMTILPMGNTENAQKSVLTNNIISSITKMSSSSNYTPTGCSKCGYGKILFNQCLVGHYAFQCLNHLRLKSNENVVESKDDKELLNLVRERSKKKKKEKKNKKEKKEKKSKKEKRHRSRSRSDSS